MVSSREVFAFIESASPVCPRNPVHGILKENHGSSGQVLKVVFSSMEFDQVGLRYREHGSWHSW